MYASPDPCMGTQTSRSDNDDFLDAAAQRPRTGAQSANAYQHVGALPPAPPSHLSLAAHVADAPPPTHATLPSMASQITMADSCKSPAWTKFPRPLHMMPGPESRNKVLVKAKWAPEYLDLTSDTEDQLPKKIRRTFLQPKTSTRGLEHPQSILNSNLRSTEHSTRSQLQRSPVDCKSSSSRSPDIIFSDKEQVSNGNDQKANDAPDNQGSTVPSVLSVSQGLQYPYKLPFLEEGYASFPSSQGNAHDSVLNTKMDLGLIPPTSDELCNQTQSLVFSPNTQTDPNLVRRKRQAALARKERIEQESMQRSKAMREAATLKHSERREQDDRKRSEESPPQPPMLYTKEQVGIPNIFSRLEVEKSSIGNNRDSHFLTNTSQSGSETTLQTSTEDGKGESQQDAGSDLFFPSQDSADGLASSFSTVQDLIRSPIANRRARSSYEATKSSGYIEALVQYNGKDHQHAADNSSYAMQDFNYDLDAGTEKLRALTKFNKQRKVGPKTTFTQRHALDSSNHIPQYLPTSASSLNVGQHSRSPFDENVGSSAKRRAEANLQAIQEGKDWSPPKKILNTLPVPINRTGGLAQLPQSIGQLATTASQRNSHSTFGYLSGKSQKINSGNTVSAEEFQVDFSRYKRQLSQHERNIIKRHEWLKEHQRDLKILKVTFIETARVSCITGVTRRMDEELLKIEALLDIVLNQGKHDKAKRDDVQKFKAKMVSTQTDNVPTANIEVALGLLIDRKTLQRIDDELKSVEDEMEVVGRERSERSIHQKRKTTKTVRFADQTLTRNSQSDGNAIEGKTAVRPARPTFGSEEDRQNKRDAYEKWAALQEATLRENLKHFDELKTPSSPNSTAINEPTAPSTTAVTEQDAQSEVSEEDDGFGYYPTFDSTSAQLLRKPASSAHKLSLEAINRLEEERKQQETHTQPPQAQPVAVGASRPTQAPDLALAKQMARRSAGIPAHEVEAALDAASDTSEDTDDGVEYVNKYYVYGMYEGFPGFEDHTKHKIGFCYDEDNARELVKDKVMEFSNTRKKHIADATAAEDEKWLAELGDPNAGNMRCDLANGEQIMDYPASSCRIWIEKKCCVAKTKQDRRASEPVHTYIARYTRTITHADGRVESEEASLDDVQIFLCAALANEEARDIMAEWYGQHLEDGYLDMQKDGLDQEVERLGEGAFWYMEEAFEVAGGKDEMKVWVQTCKGKGPTN